MGQALKENSVLEELDVRLVPLLYFQSDHAVKVFKRGGAEVETLSVIVS